MLHLSEFEQGFRCIKHNLASLDVWLLFFALLFFFLPSVQSSGRLAAMQLRNLLVQMQQRKGVSDFPRQGRGLSGGRGAILEALIQSGRGGGLLKASPIKTSGFRDDSRRISRGQVSHEQPSAGNIYVLQKVPQAATG